MKKHYVVWILVLAVAVGAQADSFRQIKDRLSAAKCVSIDFLSVLHSDVFKSVDSTHGSAYLSKDGRYSVMVGQDVYLSDNHKEYTYSPSNNQVIVRTVDSLGRGAVQLFYITRLDELYKTTILEPDKAYKLTRKGTGSSPLPDSMTVYIDKSKGQIVKIEYLDINEERVTIVIVKTSFPAACDDTRFVPKFPDSVETVKM